MAVIRNWLITSRLIHLGKQIDKSLYFNSRINQHTPLIVYQMGKVASQSIYYSLKNVYLGAVVSTHSFGPEDRDWRVRRIFQQCITESRKLNIISLTREPIGRNVSAFFQNFERDTGVSYVSSEFSLLELRELFLTNYDHDIPLTWFENHIENNFGIDVYANPFPNLGVATYTNENFRLIVLRSENNDAIKQSAIEDFLGIKEFKIDQRNIGSKKVYADTYRQFLKTVKLPPEYISKMCASRYFTHFYKDDFIDSVKRQWS